MTVCQQTITFLIHRYAIYHSSFLNNSTSDDSIDAQESPAWHSSAIFKFSP